MPTISKKLFLLIGNNNTGKTTFQKELLKRICYEARDKKLNSDLVFDINHEEIIRKYTKISFANRSIQEKISLGQCTSIEDYFNRLFEDENIAINSSHLDIADIAEIITKSKARFYNVYGVFFTNSIHTSPDRNSQAAQLDWHEIIVIDNPYIEGATKEECLPNIKSAADDFVYFLIKQINNS